VCQLLADAGICDAAETATVLALDQWRRWHAGERVPAESYLERFPQVAATPEAALELIYGEMRVREELGERPLTEAYLARFPHWAERLRQHLELHHDLAARSTDTLPPVEMSDRTTLRTEPGEMARPVPGQPTIPGYEILEVLGRGGMGVVYKARHTALRRLVALKMGLSGDLAGQEELARFRTEAEALARLKHPNIVVVYEVAEYQGRPYLSMEFVEGGTLQARLRDSLPEPRVAATLLETLARAMHAAHGCHIVHRDLKPANVLLTADGTPKITDFGLAKRLDVDVGRTHTYAIMGTASYMAPEQAAGGAASVTPLADVYALGAILYACLTGRPPFKAATLLDTLEQVRCQEPVPPNRFQPGVPRDLETICLKCLQKDKLKRYATSEALADDLRRFLNAEPICARPAGMWERGLKWARRRPATAALVGVLAVALGGLVGGILWHSAVLRERVTQAEDRASRETLRGEIQKLVGDAKLAYSKEDLHGALLQVKSAIDRMGTESTLADLREDASTLLAQVESTLAAQDARDAARANFEKFKDLLNAVRFAGTNVTGQDVASNMRAMRRDAPKALALFQINPEDVKAPELNKDHFDEHERVEITEGCHDLLVLLSEAVAWPLPAEEPKAQAGQALRLLDQAVRLRPASRGHHLRRSHFLAQMGKDREAADERRLADTLPSGPTGAADHYLMGTERYQRNDLRQALVHFDDALRTEPGHFWAQFMMAVCYLRLQRPLEARDNLSACLKQKPDFVWIYSLRGFARGELGSMALADTRLPEPRRHAEADSHFRAAEADFQKARSIVARTPNEEAEYVLLVNRGVVRIRQGKLDLAEDDLIRAIRLKPKQYPAYLNLAKVHEEKGEIREALAQIDNALKQGQGPALLYRARARLHLKRPDVAAALEDALRNLNEAITRGAAEATPPDLAAEDRKERGLVLARLDRLADAVEEYDAALALQPDLVVVHRLLAEALFQLSRYQEAVDSLDTYLKQASAALNAFLKREEPVAAAYRLRALAKGKLGNAAAGLDDYSRSLDLEPDAPTYVLRGWLYLLHFHSPLLALPDFEEALQLDAKNADAWSGRGYARVQLRQYREAVADADKARGLDPGNSRTLFNAACVYAQAAEGAEADRDLPTQSRLGQRSRFEEQAVELLRAALKAFPADGSKGFWQEVRGASALRAIRTNPGFLKLDREYAEPSK
jgi:tetratricopeptide (TPR) repeat protein